MQHLVTVRPTSADDEPFLLRLFCSAQEAQFASLNLPPDQKEQLLRMQFTAQRSQYSRQYPNADFNMVLKNGVPVGNFYAQRGPDQFVLIDVTLLPEVRNSGIGTRLVRGLMAEANAANKSLRAHVLKNNPAWRLWQRLGFRQVGDDGVYLSIEAPASDFQKP